MKKKIKIALLAMLLCVGLVFTGCGGQLDTDVNVNIGNEADYVACTENHDIMTVLMQESETPEEETTAMSVKATLKVKLDVPTGVGEETTSVDIKANVLVEITLDEEGEANVGVACKITATTEEGSEVYEIYVKDGYLYVNDGEDKEKCLLSDLIDEDASSSELVSNLSSMIVELEEVLGDYTKQKVTADGSKYMIDLDGTNLYIILKDNQFAQLYISASEVDLADLVGTIVPDAASYVQGIKVEFSFALELGNTTIDFPSLDDYVEECL